jgi:transposase
LRYRLVQTALEQGIRAAGRLFGCSRNTVRKWLRRDQEQGKPGLQERSRAPRRIPHKTPPELEQKVLQARDSIPCFGPHRLKQEFGLPCSTGAIGRILRQAGRSRRRKKPRPPVHSLARQKMQWPPFGLFEIDVKDLKDLAGYRELIPFGLPRFQFTARLVPEGTLWPAFSAVNDSTYALLFADRLLAHLARCGVDLGPLVVQTDNGSEFGGNWNRRHGLPAFTKLVEQKCRCRQHRFNPPHRSTYNSDVEAVHGIMEPEFYELERFNGSVQAFLRQAYGYQLYFNLLRRNSAKGGRTPEQLRHARAPTVSPQVCLLPPVMLSSFDAQDLPLPRQVLEGHDVPGDLIE